MIKLGERIKEFRQRNGRTQDALAEELGVTAQAVSRWEKGICYPDMEVIPSIANYFNVSIDELFGYDNERSKKADALARQINDMIHQNNGKDVSMDECIALAREALIEFPGNEKLTLALASALFTAGYVRHGEHHIEGDDGYSVYDVVRHREYSEWKEAIRLYEKLLLSLNSGEMRQQAVIELSQLYKNTGEHEKALLLAQSAPDINATTLRITTSDANIGDATSIYKVQDGQDGAPGGEGQPASLVFLTNENMTFAGTNAGKVAAATKTCHVVAYTGTTKVTPTVGTPTGMPAGMTIAVGSASDNEIPLTITIEANATLGGSGQTQGEISVPVTSPVETTLKIQWSKVNTGATGTAAYVLTVYSSDGTVFTNGQANDTDGITLQAQFYQGSSNLTANSKSYFLWEKFESGAWVQVQTDTAGTAGSAYTVHAADVQGSATYRCRARYNSTTVFFYDTITIIDKTDNYQADIDSTAGDVFKNTVGQTCLICRLWQNGQEVDPLKSTTYSKTAPSSPATGNFYYQIQNSGAATKLMRYSGSGWEDVTSDDTYKHEKTYKWYRRDKDGIPMDSGAVFATGKVIYVDGDDVTIKTVFVCEVE